MKAKNVARWVKKQLADQGIELIVSEDNLDKFDGEMFWFRTWFYRCKNKAYANIGSEKYLFDPLGYAVIDKDDRDTFYKFKQVFSDAIRVKDIDEDKLRSDISSIQNIYQNMCKMIEENPDTRMQQVSCAIEDILELSSQYEKISYCIKQKHSLFNECRWAYVRLESAIKFPRRRLTDRIDVVRELIDSLLELLAIIDDDE